MSGGGGSVSFTNYKVSIINEEKEVGNRKDEGYEGHRKRSDFAKNTHT